MLDENDTFLLLYLTPRYRISSYVDMTHHSAICDSSFVTKSINHERLEQQQKKEKEATMYTI